MDVRIKRMRAVRILIAASVMACAGPASAEENRSRGEAAAALRRQSTALVVLCNIAVGTGSLLLVEGAMALLDDAKPRGVLGPIVVLSGGVLTMNSGFYLCHVSLELKKIAASLDATATVSAGPRSATLDVRF